VAGKRLSRPSAVSENEHLSLSACGFDGIVPSAGLAKAVRRRPAIRSAVWRARKTTALKWEIAECLT